MRRARRLGRAPAARGPRLRASIRLGGVLGFSEPRTRRRCSGTSQEQRQGGRVISLPRASQGPSIPRRAGHAACCAVRRGEDALGLGPTLKATNRSLKSLTTQARHGETAVAATGLLLVGPRTRAPRSTSAAPPAPRQGRARPRLHSRKGEWSRLGCYTGIVLYA